MKKRRKSRNSAPTPLLLCTRSAILACIVTALLVLIFAFLLKWGVMQTGTIRTVNSVIKALSAGLAGYLSAKVIAERSWLFGGLAGGLYVVFSYLVFSILEREFSLSLVFLSDVLLGFVCGAGTGLMLSLIKNMRAEA
jgi:putative membrane protein (TIGR04086 family)